MTAESENPGAPDQGLAALVALLRFHGLGADPQQIRHSFGAKAIGVPEMLRCAKELGLKARAVTTRWERLVRTPLPAIAPLRDGRFLILGKVADDKALVQSPVSPRPSLMSRAEFEAVWDGRLVLMARRAGLSDLGRRFDVTWFYGAIHKYRHLLGEVLVASFFLQLFALVRCRRSTSWSSASLRSGFSRRSSAACAPISSRTAPTASMSNWAHASSAT